MKTRYKILIGMLLLLIVASCEKEYVAPNDFSDVAWYTNKQNSGDFKVKVGQHMSFMDLSQNFISHTWEIESGNNFLETGFSDDDDLSEFIDESKGLENTDLTAHILFNNQGLNKVRLYNTFSEKVTYRGEIKVDAVQEGDIWVIDTSFIVDVYGPLLPAYQIIKIIDDTLGNIISEELILNVPQDSLVYIKDSADWQTVVLEAGSRIKLLDLTKEDRPNARIWTVNNQDPASTYTDSSSVVYFNRLGKIPMMGDLLAQRKQAVGDNTPTASARKIIPLKVEVIKSTKPFIAVGNFAEIEGQEAVSFIVSGEVDEITNAEGAFTVNVKNSISGFDEDIPVSEVRTNANDASRVELVLSDTIYGNDVVTVSFDNTLGTLTSVDGRVLKSFDPQTVEMAMKGENILVGGDGSPLNWAGYEEATNSNPNQGFMAADEGTGGWWAGAPAFFKSEDLAFSGSASLKYDTDPSASSNLWRMNMTDAVSFPAGSYIIKQLVYIKGGSDIKVISNDIADKSAGWAIVLDVNWDVVSIERDKWVQLETTAVLPYALEKSNNARFGYYVKGALNPGVAASQTFYLDDLEIIPVESRP